MQSRAAKNTFTRRGVQAGGSADSLFPFLLILTRSAVFCLVRDPFWRFICDFISLPPSPNGIFLVSDFCVLRSSEYSILGKLIFLQSVFHKVVGI